MEGERNNLEEPESSSMEGEPHRESKLLECEKDKTEPETKYNLTEVALGDSSPLQDDNSSTEAVCSTTLGDDDTLSDQSILELKSDSEPCPITDLSPTALSPADLSSVDLSPSDLCPTDLSPTDLSPADLSPTDMSRTDLSTTNLSPTDLSSTDSSPADLSPTDVPPNPSFLKPFESGWRREMVYRNPNGDKRRRVDVYYYTPAGRKLRSLKSIAEHLDGTDLTLDNFTFHRSSVGIDDPDKEIIRNAKRSFSDDDFGFSKKIKRSRKRILDLSGTPRVVLKNRNEESNDSVLPVHEHVEDDTCGWLPPVWGKLLSILNRKD